MVDFENYSQNQLRQPGQMGSRPMFGNMTGGKTPPMFGGGSGMMGGRSPGGGYGQQRTGNDGNIKPVPGQPGYFQSPEGHRYKGRPGHYTPADPMPQQKPYRLRIPNPLHRPIPSWIPGSGSVGTGPEFFVDEDLSQWGLGEGVIGHWIEDNPEKAIEAGMWIDKNFGWMMNQ